MSGCLNKNSENRLLVYPVQLRPPEKAWSVKLLQGIITPNPGHVKARGCFFCRKTPFLVAINHGNPKLCLFACDKNGCENKMIRVDTREME